MTRLFEQVPGAGGEAGLPAEELSSEGPNRSSAQTEGQRLRSTESSSHVSPRRTEREAELPGQERARAQSFGGKVWMVWLDALCVYVCVRAS